MELSEFLKPRAEISNTEKVEIPGVGTVTIRGLSRLEFIMAQKLADGDVLVQERYTLSKAMIDPPMTEQDVERWQSISGPMEINEVAKAVNRLSGVTPGAAKEAYKSV